MPFRIVITESKPVTVKTREWARVNATPDSPYEYTPEIEKTSMASSAVYEQSVEALDLRRVIDAINYKPRVYKQRAKKADPA